MPRTPLLLCLALGPVSLMAAQSHSETGVQGTWRTPGNAIVRIAPCSGDASTVCATLLQLEPNPPDRVDSKNPDPSKRTRPLCGLEIGYGFRLTAPTHATDGHLYDPKSGKTYKGTMTSQGDGLDLRGYVGISAFGRTEHWTRTTQTPTCKP